MSPSMSLSRLVTLLPLALLACDPDKNGDTNPGGDTDLPDGVELKMSDKARETDPDATDEELAALVAGNNDFAFKMYHELDGISQGGDLFFSPFSISNALAMTYAGARGETATQMEEALSFTLGSERTHPAFDRLLLELESKAAEAGEDDVPFTLGLHNDVWGQYDYAWESSWLDILGVYYGAGIYLLDISGDPEGARGLINDSISGFTEGKIPELLAPGVLTADTKLVLTNAILFTAAWATPFEEEDTTDGSFTLLDGSAVDAKLMHGTMSGQYASGDGWQAVELPYDGGPFTMVAVLPDEGRFDEIEASMDGARFTTLLEELDGAELDLTVPRWSSSSSASLVDTLTALGMTDAFDPTAADFTGMLPTAGLYVADVIHQAVIDVDEEGTEAAAATAVIFEDTASIPEDPVAVSLTRPFLYAIVDHQSRTVLFLGRLSDPS